MKNLAIDRSNGTIETERRITDGLNNQDDSVLDLVTPAFLADLWQVIRSRRLGMWAAPSAVDDAAGRAFGVFRGNIQRALVDAQEEEANGSYHAQLVSILRTAAEKLREEKPDRQQCLACGTWLCHSARFCTNRTCPSNA